MNRSAAGDAMFGAVWILTPPLRPLVATLLALGVLGVSYRTAGVIEVGTLAVALVVARGSDTWAGDVMTALVAAPALLTLAASTVIAVRAEDTGDTGAAGDAWELLLRVTWRMGVAASLAAAAVWRVPCTSGATLWAYLVSLAAWAAMPGGVRWALKRGMASGVPLDPMARTLTAFWSTPPGYRTPRTKATLAIPAIGRGRRLYRRFLRRLLAHLGCGLTCTGGGGGPTSAPRGPDAPTSCGWRASRRLRAPRKSNPLRGWSRATSH